MQMRLQNGNGNGLVFFAATISQLVPCAIQEQMVTLHQPTQIKPGIDWLCR
jgi:hypothetical protein